MYRKMPDIVLNFVFVVVLPTTIIVSGVPYFDEYLGYWKTFIENIATILAWLIALFNLIACVTLFVTLCYSSVERDWKSKNAKNAIMACYNRSYLWNIFIFLLCICMYGFGYFITGTIILITTFLWYVNKKASEEVMEDLGLEVRNKELVTKQ